MIKFFMKKSFLFFLSLALFFLLFLMIKDDKSGKPVTLQKGDSFIEGLRLIHRQNGSTDWVLTARRADISKKGDEAYLSGIEMTLEKKGITVRADKGLYNMAKRDLTTDGPVTASGDSYSITSEGVSFDGASGAIRTDGAVRLDSRKFSVRGTGMDAYDAGQTVRIRKNVAATFYN